MTNDKDIIPLDNLADMAKWIAKHREEENAIVITIGSGFIKSGASGEVKELIKALNYAIYNLIGELEKEEK